MNIIKDTFANDPDFISALDKACATVVNMKLGNRLSAKAPELVSRMIRRNL
jgi:hypothetical protein